MASDFGFLPVKSGKFYFISYNTEDSARIIPIVRIMHDSGVPFWYDYGLEYGREWETQIAMHIEECEAVLMFVTQALFQKEKSYVRKEYEEAVIYKKKIIPVFLDKIDPATLPKHSIGFYLDLNRLHGVSCAGDSVQSIAQRAAWALGMQIDSTTAVHSVKRERTVTQTKAEPAAAPVRAVTPAPAPAPQPKRTTEPDADVQRILQRMESNPNTDVRQEISRVMGESRPTATAARSSASADYSARARVSAKVLRQSQPVFKDEHEDEFEPERKNIVRPVLIMLCVVAAIAVIVFIANVFNGISMNSCTNDDTVSSEASGGEVSSEAEEERTIEQDGITYRIEDGNAAVIDCDYNKTEAVILAEIDGAEVTAIEAYAFNGKLNLTSITIPDSVTSIGDKAFNYCGGLTSINIPASVTHIGFAVFWNCYSLTRIDVDAGNTNYRSLGGSLFSYNFEELICVPSGIDGKYEIPDGVKVIGNVAFGTCDFTNIIIPDSVTYINEGAFERCENLTSITIPDSVTTIGSYAFCWCNRLESVTIPDSVTDMGESVFYNCDSLKNVIVPKSIKTINKEMFWSCDWLSDISLPNGILSIGDKAFSYCIRLKNITIPDSVTKIDDYTFAFCTITVYAPHPPEYYGYTPDDGVTWVVTD